MSAKLAASDRPAWLPEAEFPFASRWLTIDGHQIHYIDEGRGRTLLFLHAGPGWLFIYRDLIMQLRDQFRCVGLDLPGTGLSRAAPGYQPSIEAASEVVGAFIRTLDLRNITLVVHDVGTPVALGAAVRMPDRFTAVAITEGFAWPLAAENPGIARTLRIVGSRPVGLLNDVFNVLARATVNGATGAGRHLSAAGKRAFLGPYRERAARRNAAAMLRDAAESSQYLRQLESQLRAALGDRPILLVFGSASPTVKENFPERWKHTFPAAQLVMVEGGHHFPMSDSPDLVAGAIRKWLT